MKTTLNHIKPGETVKYHGELCIVLEHREDGTLLMVANQISHTFGKTNNYAESSLREHLNGAYLDALTENHPDEIITRMVYLTAMNGSREYGACVCKIAPLTLDEIRRFHGILPTPKDWEWSVTPWYTPAVNKDTTGVTGLITNGTVNNLSCADTCWSRPAFILPSEYIVETEDKKPRRRVSFGMYWQSYGRQVIDLPDDIDTSDKDAVLDYIKSVWDDIPLPAGDYVSCSDELDEESPLEIFEEEGTSCPVKQ